MTHANTLVFQKLAKFCNHNALNLSKSKKYIVSNDIDKLWLKSVEFLKNEDLFIDRYRFFCLALFNNEKYIIQVGFGPIFTADEDFILQPNNGGIFAALVSELNLPVLENFDLEWELNDKIYLPSTEDEKSAFEYTDIEKYFIKYFIYKLTPNSNLWDEENSLTLQKTALYLLAKSPEVMYLDVSEKVLDSLQSLARLDVRVIPFDRIFRAFIERRYENAFLDLYRCFEMLFSLKKIDILKSFLKLDSKHFEISANIEAALGWRPAEKGALKEIIDQLPCELLDPLKQSFNNTAEVWTNIYGLRNECVHFRPLQKKTQLAKQVDWAVLLESMVPAIHHAYHINYRKMF